MVGRGGSSAGSYLADPTSPIPSHCASIVATSILRVNQSAPITNNQDSDMFLRRKTNAGSHLNITVHARTSAWSGVSLGWFCSRPEVNGTTNCWCTDSCACFSIIVARGVARGVVKAHGKTCVRAVHQYRSSWLLG